MKDHIKHSYKMIWYNDLKILNRFFFILSDIITIKLNLEHSLLWFQSFFLNVGKTAKHKGFHHYSYNYKVWVFIVIYAFVYFIFMLCMRMKDCVYMFVSELTRKCLTLWRMLLQVELICLTSYWESIAMQKQ